MSYTNGLDNPELYFQCKLYTGNGTDDTSYTFDGSEDMQPDLLWFKERSSTSDHALWDSVRGTNKKLEPSTTQADSTEDVITFDSDGFSVDDHSQINQNTITMVCWAWKETATAGFDIVSFTGNATNRTISHSLSAVPHLIIVKNRADAENWTVYHGANTSAPETDFLHLNTTAATSDSNTPWNDTAPTSSVFTVGTSGKTNGNTHGMIAYCFSEKQGFSKFGSYTGNGNADGTFIYTGFRPAYLLVKRTDSTGDWYIFDNKITPSNQVQSYQNSNKAEADHDVSAYYMDILSNGFKWRGSGSELNASGGTYIYAAFAEASFVNSKGVPCNAR